jgi:sugar porter (SP) family MFS transporter
MIRIGGEDYAREELRGIDNSIEHSSSILAELWARPFRDIFLIGIALAILQQITGINVFLYYGPEIFKSIVKGTQTDVALLQTIVIGAFNMIFTIVAFTSVDRFGRRPLMLIGASGMCLALTAMGLAAYLGRTEGWLLVFILVYIASFALAVGPVTWVILSEIFPTRMRGTAMAVATVCLWIANYGVSQTFPMMDKSTLFINLFHHAFPFWVYAVFCVVLFALVLKMIPETKGKSLEEIERYWENRRRQS